MISIPESRYIELISIEQKYKAGDFNNYELYALYVELNSLINAGLCISNDVDNPGNDSIWRRISDKVLSLCGRWRELVPDFIGMTQIVLIMMMLWHFTMQLRIMSSKTILYQKLIFK